MIPQPVITPIPSSGGLAMVYADWQIKLPVSGKTLLVKVGFRTDGASIPEEAWSFIFLAIALAR